MIDGPAFPADSWPAPPASVARAPAAGSGFHLFGKDGFSFWDLVDIVNPLHHIPVVSTLYRRISGDRLDALPRVAGGALFGGIAGVVSAIANLVVNEATGRDIGASVLALVENSLIGEDQSDPSQSVAGVAPEPKIADNRRDLAFSAGWQAAMAMPYCDAECLDTRRSYFTDAAAAAAARYAETAAHTSAGQMLDMQG